MALGAGGKDGLMAWEDATVGAAVLVAAAGGKRTVSMTMTLPCIQHLSENPSPHAHPNLSQCGTPLHCHLTDCTFKFWCSSHFGQ